MSRDHVTASADCSVVEDDSKDKAESFRPKQDWIMLSQGAEARIWKIPMTAENGCQPSFQIAKERFAKKYRHPILDTRLTKQRCKAEARILHQCRNLDGNGWVPQVFRVDAPILYLKWIDGHTVRQELQKLLLNSGDSDNVLASVNKIATSMGAMIGKLHG